MDHVEKYRKRRDARMRKRMDAEQWKTIRGTHVMIDDEGQVTKGPENLKKLVNGSGGYSPEKKSAAGKYKTTAAYKKALEDRKSAMSEKVAAEEAWKEAKAFRATMHGKTEASLKKDIEEYKKSGDLDKLDKAQHDLKRYRDRIKKYGKDFGVAEAEKRMNDAEKKHSDIDKEIGDFEKARGFGEKGVSYTVGGKTWDKDTLKKYYQEKGENDRRAEWLADRDLKEAVAAQKKIKPMGNDEINKKASDLAKSVRNLPAKEEAAGSKRVQEFLDSLEVGTKLEIGANSGDSEKTYVIEKVDPAKWDCANAFYHKMGTSDSRGVSSELMADRVRRELGAFVWPQPDIHVTDKSAKGSGAAKEGDVDGFFARGKHGKTLADELAKKRSDTFKTFSDMYQLTGDPTDPYDPHFEPSRHKRGMEGMKKAEGDFVSALRSIPKGVALVVKGDRGGDEIRITKEYDNDYRRDRYKIQTLRDGKLRRQTGVDMGGEGTTSWGGYTNDHHGESWVFGHIQDNAEWPPRIVFEDQRKGK